MHSLQMNTLGPAINRSTSVSALPQKLQRLSLSSLFKPLSPYFSVEDVRVNTSSIKPYRFASSADMKLSRSVSCAITSIG